MYVQNKAPASAGAFVYSEVPRFTMMLMAARCVLCGEANHACGGTTEGVVIPVGTPERIQRGSSEMAELKRYKVGNTVLQLNEDDAKRKGVWGHHIPANVVSQHTIEINEEGTPEVDASATSRGGEVENKAETEHVEGDESSEPTDEEGEESSDGERVTARNKRRTTRSQG